MMKTRMHQAANVTWTRVVTATPVIHKKNLTQLTNVSKTNCSIALSLLSVSSAATNANTARNIKATPVRVTIVSMSKAVSY